MGLGRYDGIGGHEIRREPTREPAPTGLGLNQAALGTLSSIETRLRDLIAAVKVLPQRPQMADRVELRKRIESGEWVPYNIKTFALDTARTDEKVVIEGDFIHAWTDGTLNGIGVRIGRVQNDLCYFKRRNPVSGFSFWEFFLTHSAQAGKTLDLMIGREASAQAQTTEVTVSASQRFDTVRTDKDTHFTGAIAQNAKEDENLTGLLADKIRITGITIQSDQRLNYKLLLWYKDSFEDADLDLDMFCGEAELDLISYGIQVGGANQWYLDVRNLHIDYEDQDATKELHVSLFNNCPTAKNAGATGEVVVVITYEVRA